MPPYILFVSYTADWTGPTNSLLLLLKYLRSGYRVAVLLPGHGQFTEILEQEGIPFFSLPSLSKKALPAMIRLMRREGISLVYGNNTSSSSRNASIASRVLGIPFVNHVREMGWGKTRKALKYLESADGVIAVSEACATSVYSFVNRDKLYVVYNGGEENSGKHNRNQERAQLLSEIQLPEDSLIVISVAHVAPRKGQEYAVRMMAGLTQKLTSVHLLLVGALDRDVAYVDKLRATIEELNLKDYITLLGFRLDVLQLMRASDIYLHTAIADPHPRSVIEGMESGLPVAAFSTDGVAETVADGLTGILVEKQNVASLENAVMRLVEDPILRARYGEEGKRLAGSDFSAEKTASRISAVIDQVLVESKTRNISVFYRLRQIMSEIASVLSPG